MTGEINNKEEPLRKANEKSISSATIENKPVSEQEPQSIGLNGAMKDLDAKPDLETDVRELEHKKLLIHDIHQESGKFLDLTNEEAFEVYKGFVKQGGRLLVYDDGDEIQISNVRELVDDFKDAVVDSRDEARRMKDEQNRGEEEDLDQSQNQSELLLDIKKEIDSRKSERGEDPTFATIRVDNVGKKFAFVKHDITRESAEFLKLGYVQASQVYRDFINNGGTLVYKKEGHNKYWIVNIRDLESNREFIKKSRDEARENNAIEEQNGAKEEDLDQSQNQSELLLDIKKELDSSKLKTGNVVESSKPKKSMEEIRNLLEARHLSAESIMVNSHLEEKSVTQEQSEVKNETLDKESKIILSTEKDLSKLEPGQAVISDPKIEVEGDVKSKSVHSPEVNSKEEIADKLLNSKQAELGKQIEELKSCVERLNVRFEVQKGFIIKEKSDGTSFTIIPPALEKKPSMVKQLSKLVQPPTLVKQLINTVSGYIKIRPLNYIVGKFFRLKSPVERELKLNPNYVKMCSVILQLRINEINNLQEQIQSEALMKVDSMLDLSDNALISEISTAIPKLTAKQTEACNEELNEILKAKIIPPASHTSKLLIYSMKLEIYDSALKGNITEEDREIFLNNRPILLDKIKEAKANLEAAKKPKEEVTQGKTFNIKKLFSSTKGSASREKNKMFDSKEDKTIAEQSESKSDRVDNLSKESNLNEESSELSSDNLQSSKESKTTTEQSESRVEGLKEGENLEKSSHTVRRFRYKRPGDDVKTTSVDHFKESADNFAKAVVSVEGKDSAVQPDLSDNKLPEVQAGKGDGGMGR